MSDNIAYAIAVCEANFSLLVSEAGRNHSKEQIRAKLPVYENGYFLRDPNSKLDCQFFLPEAFEKLYEFRFVYDGNPLQEVIRI